MRQAGRDAEVEDEHAVNHGNDWARGFVRGMHMCHDSWAELLNDGEHESTVDASSR